MADRHEVPRQGAAALALRLAGAGFDEVAMALGMDTAGDARVAAEKALEARAWQNEAGRERLRDEATARLERLLRGVWPKATTPDHPEHVIAVRVAKELIDRLIRLHGLDAPAEIVVHTPTAAEIDTWVRAVVQNEPLAAIEANVTGEVA